MKKTCPNLADNSVDQIIVMTNQYTDYELIYPVYFTLLYLHVNILTSTHRTCCNKQNAMRRRNM